MKATRLILLTAIAALLASCGSKRHAVNDPIAEDYIAAEMAKQSQKDKKDKPKKAKKRAQLLVDEAMTWRGTPYKYGGQSKKGTDCSGFVMQVYLNALGIKIPRSSADQSKYCRTIDKKSLDVGDILFFHGGKKGKVSHVGLYIGSGKMIHASSSKGVIISDINDDYYVRNYNHSGRVPDL